MDRGSIELFMAVKLAVAVASVSLLGATLSWGEAFSRNAALDELKYVVDVIARSIADIQSMPSCCKVTRSIPMPAQDFEVVVVEEPGKKAGIAVVGRYRVERHVPLSLPLSGDTAKNPRAVMLVKDGNLRLRLIQ